ncbi:MAG TPA: polysaccharide biosynthesis/export family protein [Verrucomicrobiales bacterium]|nr:polysaccharide biosynthesis/export family protein [Verrucomicrobiales bacterium]
MKSPIEFVRSGVTGPIRGRRRPQHLQLFGGLRGGLLSSIFCCAILFPGTELASAQTPAGKPAGTRKAEPALSRALPDATAAANPATGSALSSRLPASPALPPPSDNYVLNRGDTVKLSVFQESGLDAEATLSKSGEASFPLIGAVSLAGKTVKSAEKLIEDLYNRDYLVNPRVSLTLTGYAQHFVTVSGAVAAPRVVAIPLEGRFDVLAAIAAAGGTTEKADLRSVVLRHANGGNSIRCDVNAMQANPALARELLPGDSITVPQKVEEFVTVSGEVTRPARVVMPDSGQLDVLTAITMAGDYTKLAKPKSITVTRNGRIIKLDGTAMANGTAPAFQLLPGDRVNVGKRIF